MSILTTLPPELYPADAFAGAQPDPAFSIGTARAMAWLCQLAYEVPDREKIAAILKTWDAAKLYGTGLIATAISTPLPLTRAEAFLAERAGVRYLAFAGTDPVVVADWITDFRFHPDAAGIAAGFAEAAASTLPNIKRMLAADRHAPLYVTGHSLGGALAVIVAAALRAEDFAVTAVYTFGMPRPGTENFKTSYDAALGDTTYRLVNAADIVPTVAPSRFGMRHVGRLLRCEADAKFDPLMLAPDAHSDEPAFAEVWAGTVRDSLRQPWKRPASVLEAARRFLDPNVPRAGNTRSDLVGLIIETLPPGVRDHLPDRYIAALS